MPEQSGPLGALLVATIVPSNVTSPPTAMPPPSAVTVPPDPETVFRATVSSTRCPGDGMKNLPPNANVFPPDLGDVARTEFKATVEFLMVPEDSRMPPALPSASVWAWAVTMFRLMVAAVMAMTEVSRPPPCAEALAPLDRATSVLRSTVDLDMETVFP